MGLLCAGWSPARLEGKKRLVTPQLAGAPASSFQRGVPARPPLSLLQVMNMSERANPEFQRPVLPPAAQQHRACRRQPGGRTSSLSPSLYLQLVSEGCRAGLGKGAETILILLTLQSLHVVREVWLCTHILSQNQGEMCLRIYSSDSATHGTGADARPGAGLRGEGSDTGPILGPRHPGDTHWRYVRMLGTREGTGGSPGRLPGGGSFGATSSRSLACREEGEGTDPHPCIPGG